MGGQTSFGERGGGKSTTTVTAFSLEVAVEDNLLMVVELDDDIDDVDNRDASLGFADAYGGRGASELE